MAIGLIKNCFGGLGKRHKEETSNISVDDIVVTNIEGAGVMFIGLIIFVILVSSINILFQNLLLSGILGATLFITTAYILW